MTTTTYQIILGPLAESELHEVRAYEHRRIIEAIEQRLQHEPLVENRNRKPLDPAPPEMASELEAYFPEGVPPMWELRIGSWRAIYGIRGQEVHILRIVKKGRTTTGRALS